jgi:drug/metabolite transporter (DMT)-like permease
LDSVTATPNHSRIAAVGMLFLIGFAFALTFVFNRLATTNGIPFLPYVFWQALEGALILFAIAITLGHLPSFSTQNTKLYLITGTLNVSLPICILSFVAPKVPAGVLSLGLMLIPTMIYGLALSLGMDRFSWVRAGGIALGFAGVLLVVLPSASLPSPDLTGWVLIGLLAPVCYALGAIVMGSMGRRAARSLPLACGLLLASAVTLLLVMVTTGNWWFFSREFTIGQWALIAAGINQAAIFVLMFEIIKRAGPVFFSTSNYIATILGVILGMWLFGDSHSLWIWAAMSLMFAGLFCVNVAGIR